MGQAKQRGTREERVAAAVSIIAQAQEAEHIRRRDAWNAMNQRQKDNQLRIACNEVQLITAGFHPDVAHVLAGLSDKEKAL